jgi:hypothetical protein
MKTAPKLQVLIFIMLFLFSCDDPETVVTNFVHPDGSVTRRVVMRSSKKTVEPSQYQVPLDSTWTISTGIEPREKDTTWIVTAEKNFSSVDEINSAYRADSGANKLIKRSAEFSRSFRWFNTFYRYSEKVDKVLNTKLKAEQVLSEEELRYFYMPSSMLDSLLAGADSLMYKEKKAKNDSVENRYLFKALMEEWTMQYFRLNPDSAYIIPRKDKMLEMAVNNDTKGDTLIQIVLGEEYYSKNKLFIDQALKEVDSLFEKAMSAKFYTCETVMPFKLVATNGFVDKNGKISWPVDSKYFVSQDYLMWAESKKPNTWAWVVSGVFVVFVMAGLIVKGMRRKGE